MTVYRDAHGVPHIVAETETSAWYALGFEQARDGLLWIQYCCRAARGQLSSVIGSKGLYNDLAAKILGAHLGGRPAAQLRTLLSPANTTIQANFYDNCVAFAAGADAYRVLVAQPPNPSTPEGRLRIWLDTKSFVPGTSLAWVYTDTITAADIASQGGWTSAFWSFFGYAPPVVNSTDAGYALTGGAPDAMDPDLVVDPWAPGLRDRFFAEVQRTLVGIPGGPSAMAGSNSFAWSGLHCAQTVNGQTVRYPGLLADPHQALPFYGPAFAEQFPDAANHLWFAHVKVTPPGAAQPTLDAFGHVPYAAATWFSHHNRNVAVGGTQGAPNYTDHFVLRLREDANGNAHPNHEFYSYYLDSPGPSGNGTNTTYQALTPSSVAITVAGSSTPVNIPFWRAGSFGFILANAQGQLPVVYGERVDPAQLPPRWRVSARYPQPPKMRFWPNQKLVNGQPTRTPMVVAFRVPMDSAVAGNPAVAGENRHWQLMRDFWEIAHAGTVDDVMPRTNGGAYLVNLCAVDRHGGTLSTQQGAIPMRGDDAALRAASPPYVPIDKQVLYGGLVPARHYRDRMFDWRFGSSGSPSRPAPLNYLDYPPVGPTGAMSLPPPITVGSNSYPAPFKPVTRQLQPSNIAFPPVAFQGTGLSYFIQSGFFTSACNDQIWGYSRKRDVFQFQQPSLWNDVHTDNWLWLRALEAGCSYQSTVLAIEAPDRQQIVVDRFARQCEAITGPGAGLPPLTPAQMRAFVVSPRHYVERAYTVPAAGMTTGPILADSPTPIRQIREVVDNVGFQHPTELEPTSPVLRANRELAFLRDVWNELHRPGSPWRSYTVQPGLVVNLRDLWVGGGDPAHPARTDQVFWYDGAGVPQWFDMPHDFPLIDFLWEHSELGSGFTAAQAAPPTSTANPAVLPTTDWNNLLVLLGTLETWQSGVLLADRYHSVPTSPGACLLEMMRVGYRAQRDFARKWRRLVRGVPETSRREPAWSKLEALAFPGEQMATLFRGGVNPPYDAIYANGQSGSLKALQPPDVNKLVKFFLELGGHYIDPAINDGNPSRKLARWQLVNGDVDKFLDLLPGGYPLPGGCERVTVLRRLLDAGTYLNANMAIPPMSQHFRARAYDHNGVQVWPAAQQDAACVGPGLRSVFWYQEDWNLLPSERTRGFQPKFLGMSGSYATLLALFPSTGGVESHFWCTPGVAAMNESFVPAPGVSRFEAHMNACATNTLMQSHYSDFTTNYVPPIVTHTSPY